MLQLETPTFDEAELIRNACLRRALQGRSSLVVEADRPSNVSLDGYLANPPGLHGALLAAIAEGC